MTNREARMNYLVSLEHHKAFIALWQTKALLATDLAERMTALEILENHVKNLVDGVDEYKSIDDNEDTFSGPRSIKRS